MVAAVVVVVVVDVLSMIVYPSSDFSYVPPN